MTFKPQHCVAIEVPKATKERTTETVVIEPEVIEATWLRNDHLLPDELHIVVDGRDAGFDVRTLRNARCSYYLWDSNQEDFVKTKHQRFTGILLKADRELDENKNHLSLVFRDWTELFVENKALPTSGIPEWSDTLRSAWERIVDNTGYWDPDQEKIISSVEYLRDKLVFSDPSLESKTLGEMVGDRFLTLSKPSPKQNANSWDVWQWIVQALALISYVDRDEVHVKRIVDHFSTGSAPAFLLGRNLLSLKEEIDTEKVGRGVILRSFNPLAGRVVESVYPPPGDPRVKHPRQSASGARKPTKLQDPLSDYLPFNYFYVVDQKTLNRRAQEAWEEMRRQELKVRFTTSDLDLRDEEGRSIGSLFSLSAGDSVVVDIDPESRREILELASEQDRVRRLVARGYRHDVANLKVLNSADDDKFSHRYHLESLTVNVKPDALSVEGVAHNVVQL